jgi:hypothetical protein
VGQSIELPTGYKGYILRTSKPHEVTITSTTNDAGPSRQRSNKDLPPTPSSSGSGSGSGSAAGGAGVGAGSTTLNGVSNGDSPRRSARRTSSISNLASVIKGKVKGAGQVAFSRPKTRQVINKKRFRLDSDDEDDEEDKDEQSQGQGKGQATRNGERVMDENKARSAGLHHEGDKPSNAGPVRTPSKRTRLTRHTPRKQERSPSPVPDPSLPSIIIQEATPLKEPLPPRIKFLNTRSAHSYDGGPDPDQRPRSPRRRSIKLAGGEDSDGDSDGDELSNSPSKAPIGLGLSSSTDTLVDDSESATSSQGPSTGTNTFEAHSHSGTQDDRSEIPKRPRRPSFRRTSTEQVIPSPSTENDPPMFSLPTPEPSLVDIKVGSEDDSNHSTTKQKDSIGSQQEETVDEQYDGPTRVLRPVSTFSEFMLWTPDGPLPGFRADELSGRVQVKQSTKVEANAENFDGAVKAEGENGQGPTDSATADDEEAKVNIKPVGLDTTEDGGVKLREGWWRTGGAGEGGDEIVRAMGEWLGLVECVSFETSLPGCSLATHSNMCIWPSSVHHLSSDGNTSLLCGSVVLPASRGTSQFADCS